MWQRVLTLIFRNDAERYKKAVFEIKRRIYADLWGKFPHYIR